MNHGLILSIPALLTACLTGVLILAGCGVGPGMSCTEIGCQDQLRIEFVDEDGTALTSFEGEIIYDGETVEFECSPGSMGGIGFNCGDDGLYIYASPDEAELTVTSGTLEKSETLTPEYSEEQPNGAGCPPICLMTSVSVTLLEAAE